jgi:hypothetical protein
MSWEPTGSGVNPVRRFWWGVRLWNGGAVLVWLSLVGWRTLTYPPSRFLIVSMSGLLNAAVVFRVLFPGKNAL